MASCCYAALTGSRATTIAVWRQPMPDGDTDWYHSRWPSASAGELPAHAARRSARGLLGLRHAPASRCSASAGGMHRGMDFAAPVRHAGLWPSSDGVVAVGAVRAAAYGRIIRLQHHGNGIGDRSMPTFRDVAQWAGSR